MGRGQIALVALTAAGCAARQPTDTLDEALAKASRAMIDGDAPALLAMLDERLKVGVTGESLAKDLAKNSAEYADLAAMLSSPTSIEFEAIVKTDSGDTIALVLEEDSWKLDTSVLAPDAAGDPMTALRRLASHLKSLAASILETHLLAEQHDKGFIATLESLAAEIEQIRPQDLVLSEDRCYCNLPSGRKVELVREEDTWKIFSIFPPLEFR